MNGNFTPEPVTSSGPKAKSVRDNSKGRVMTIRGASSSVAKGNLSPRSGLNIVNKK